MNATDRALKKRMTNRRLMGLTVPPVVYARTLETAPVTTPYRKPGDLWALGYHTGEDHSCPTGSYALATSWGRVVYASGHGGPVASWGVSYGLHVVIRTGDNAYDYMPAHLARVLVKPGDDVWPGRIVGLTGSTGKNSTGPHVHFEARPAWGRYGSDVSPMLVKRMRTT